MRIKHAFTIDVEDWYHGIELSESEWFNKERRIDRGINVILNLLDESRTKATFFCLGWVAKEHPGIIKKINQRGHEIAGHGFFHRKVYNMTPDKFRIDIRDTKKLLEDLISVSVRGHRSPFFSITRKSLWGLDILIEEGYEYDASISPVETWRYGISSSPEGVYRIKHKDSNNGDNRSIIEFPMSTFSFFKKRIGFGGAYFRIMPWCFTNFALKRKQGSCAAIPLIFYAHPWEYDPEHPVIDFESKAKMTHYYNLTKTEKRTKMLLEKFSFTCLAEVLEEIISTDNFIETVNL
ncbi:MAG: DUF3473 domain-containing protein [Oligoflexia bacterium]|nr:DUF3473 domain-containing protein [Oligoflexia bacterium]